MEIHLQNPNPFMNFHRGELTPLRVEKEMPTN